MSHLGIVLSTVASLSGCNAPAEEASSEALVETPVAAAAGSLPKEDFREPYQLSSDYLEELSPMEATALKNQYAKEKENFDTKFAPVRQYTMSRFDALFSQVDTLVASKNYQYKERAFVFPTTPSPLAVDCYSKRFSTTIQTGYFLTTRLEYLAIGSESSQPDYISSDNSSRSVYLNLDDTGETSLATQTMIKLCGSTEYKDRPNYGGPIGF